MVEIAKVTHRSQNYVVGEGAKKGTGLEYLSFRERPLIGHFNGLPALFEFLKVHCPEPQQEEASAKKRNGDEFYHFDTYEECLEVFEKNPSSIREFTEADIQLNGGDTGLKVVSDTTGDVIDMGKFLEGEPECWNSLTDGTPRGKRVHLVVSADASCGTPQVSINQRAKRILRLADWLESQNVRTRITMVQSNDCGHFDVRVKDYEHPLDLNDLAVAGNPDYLRRIGFRFLEYSPAWRYGYGSARDFNDYVSRNPDILGTEPGEITLYVGNYYNGKIDKQFEDIEKTLTEQLSGEATVENLAVMA